MMIMLAMKNALSLIGFDVETHCVGLRVAHHRGSAMILFQQWSGIAFDESAVQSVDQVFVVFPFLSREWNKLECPHLRGAIRLDPIFQLLKTVLTCVAQSATDVRAPVDSCTIQCVFTRQMDEGVSIIQHDLFGTTSTYGTGKRVLDGTANAGDLELYRQRLKTTLASLEERRVTCSFISEDRHPFPRCIALIQQVGDLLGTVGTAPAEVRNKILELQQVLSSSRGSQCSEST